MLDGFDFILDLQSLKEQDFIAWVLPDNRGPNHSTLRRPCRRLSLAAATDVLGTAKILRAFMAGKPFS
jgi:hypothetical protein